MRSRYFKALAALAFALTLCAFAPPRAAAHDPRAHGAKSPAVYTCPMHPEVKSKKKGTCPKCKMDLRPARAEAESAAAKTGDAHEAHVASKMSIPDVELLDQDGRRVRFYTDLVKGKVVAVNFVFTTCTTVCPPLGATFARVQRELAGRDVHLISVSVDPATDTPERLKAWGGKFKAGPGWTLLTGPKPQVDELLKALGAATASPSDHTPTVLVGNDARGQWTRAYGLARPAVLIKLIDAAAAGRLDAANDSTSKESARQ
ncbi:MAG TPA: SCO family protein [Pyrinomonadaceae bacterium]|nr:SCO family protein [Pyrinomonadaceae bacterium]